MKKTVFEGIINDKVYNDVNEYNKEITKLLNNGEEFTASTSTKTVDTCDECGSTPCMCSEETPKVKANLHIGMDHNKPLADYYLSGNETDEATLDQISEVLEVQSGLIKNEITNMSIAQVNDYLKDLQVIRKSIKNQKSVNTKAIEEAENKYNFLLDAGSLIEMFDSFYETVNEVAVERLGEIANNNVEKPTDRAEEMNKLNAQAEEIIEKFKDVWTKMFGGSLPFPR